jgi:hypothetical protein
LLTVRTGVLKQRFQIAPHFDGSNCAYHDGVVAALVLAVDFAAESDGGVKHGAEGAQLVGNLIELHGAHQPGSACEVLGDFILARREHRESESPRATKQLEAA